MSTNATYIAGSFSAQVGIFADILPEDKARDYLQIQNKGTSNVFVNFGLASGASEANSILLAPGAFYEPFTAPVNPISVAVDSLGSGAAEVWFASDASTSVTAS